MRQKIKVKKAELSMKLGGFIMQKHKNPVLNRLAKFASWANRKQYSSDTLDFLKEEDSIDILDDEKYEQGDKK